MNFLWRIRLFIGGELNRLVSIILPEIEDVKGCTNKAEWVLREKDPYLYTYSCTDCLSDMVAIGTILIEPVDDDIDEQCCFWFGTEGIEFLPLMPVEE